MQVSNDSTESEESWLRVMVLMPLTPKPLWGVGGLLITVSEPSTVIEVARAKLEIAVVLFSLLLTVHLPRKVMFRLDF